MDPPTTHSTLERIPPGILNRISSFIDHKSAVALSRASKTLRPYGVAQLWRNLDVTRERGNYLMLNSESDSELDEAVEDSFRYEQEKRRLDLRYRLATVIKQGDGRWPQVQSFTAVLRPGAEIAIVAILGKIAPTVRVFDLTRATDERRKDAERKKLLDYGLIWCKRTLDRAGQNFPLLTRISLGRNLLEDARTVTLLLNIAPHTTILEFSLSDSATRTRSEIAVPRETELQRPLAKDTKLVQLRIDYTSDEDQTEMDDASPNNPFTTVINLLEKSPLIRLLSLSVYNEGGVSRRLAERVAALKHLEDATWGAISDVKKELVEMPGSAVLQRLALAYGMTQWKLPTSATDDNILFPALRTVFFHSWCPNRATTPSFPPPAPVLPIKAGFARWLRQRPQLRDIYFQPFMYDFRKLTDIEKYDIIEQSPSNAKISSIRRGTEELLIIRLHLYDVVEKKRRGRERIKETRRIIYQGTKVAGWGAMDPGGEPAWQLFTSYDGLMVPLEVVEQVKAAEYPAGEMDWERRSVEVGEAAWKFLRDWREGQPDAVEEKSEVELEEDNIEDDGYPSYGYSGSDSDSDSDSYW